MMQASTTLRAKVTTSPNIALIKYWGKYHEELILPINSSVSLTLDPEDLSTTTSIEFSDEHKEDQLWLNSERHELTKRVKKILERTRRQAEKYKQPGEGWEKKHFKICSTNSFPTASGLASSASGLAALVLCLNTLFDGLYNEQEVAELTRMGSGSACRSLFGGLVQWQGIPREYIQHPATEEQLQQLSKQCIASQLISEKQLQHVRIIILLSGAEKKDTSSTDGMKTSVQTSALIHHRNEIAASRITTLLESIRKDDFDLLAVTTIRDSNQFHAVCLDTYPPIFYLNEFSRSVMQLVDHRLNPILKRKIGYTFDAGPHAFLILHESVLQEVFSFLMHLYKPKQEQLNAKATHFWKELQSNGKNSIRPEFSSLLSQPTHTPTGIWLSNVGGGPTAHRQ